jgi:hypothetical protein
MLSNREFSAITGLPIILAPEFEEFALFNLDMSEYSENGEVLFPNLANRMTADLWIVRKHKTKRESIRLKREATRKEKEVARQANLQKYIQRGYAFDPLAGVDSPVANKMVEV